MRNLACDLGVSEVWTLLSKSLLHASLEPIMPSEFFPQVCPNFLNPYTFQLNYIIDKVSF
jgi:hypothetical protein